MFTLLTNLFTFLFGKPKKHISTDLEIKFHKDANFFGEHGTINVSHVRLGLVETPVRFVFAGVTTPPRLDLTTYIRIWEEARAQGFVPHHLVTYGKNNEVIDVSKPADTTVNSVYMQTPLGVNHVVAPTAVNVDDANAILDDVERQANKLIDQVSSKQLGTQTH